MTVDELRKEAEQLSENERGHLVADLLASFGVPHYDVSDDEVTRRVTETESGDVEDISYEELRSRVEASRRK